ncbi:hypothetical protein EON63_06205 [archaeon]|nr:MAG: hypothetical protein EON63_06205 [archaeon]
MIFQHLFEVRFLSTLSNQALVVLLYKRPLDAQWKEVADELGRKLGCKVLYAYVYGMVCVCMRVCACV